MPLTPAYSIPYPVGSDLVRDGDNNMQAIAERIEALLTPVAGEAWSTGNQTVGAYGVRWFVLNSSELTGGLAVAQSNVPSLGGNVNVRLVLPKAGRYLITAGAEFDYPSSPGNVLCGVGIYLNQPGEVAWGTGLLRRAFVHPMQESTNNGNVSCQIIRNFAANDYLCMAVIQNSGLSCEVGGGGRPGSYLGAMLIDPRN